MQAGKTIITDVTSIPETVKWIKKLTIDASKDPRVQKIAEQCLKNPEPLRCAFDSAYDLLTYMPDEIECNACGWRGVKPDKIENKIFCPRCHSNQLQLKQQLRTIDNIFRNKVGNCTHYAILIGGVLINMKVGFRERVVGYDRPNKYDHIYVVTNSGIVLDPVQGQKQDGTDTKFNRPPKGMFNKEVKYRYKLDYPMPNLEILQGTLGCDQAFSPIVNNRSTAARLGLISGYVGCSVVGGVTDAVLGSHGRHREKHAANKATKDATRLARKDKRRANKTAHKIEVIKARQAGNTTSTDDGGGEPVNSDNIQDRLNNFAQNSGISIPGLSNNGGSSNVPAVQDQSQTDGNDGSGGGAQDDDTIMGLSKPVAIVGGLGLVGIAIYMMSGKKGKGKKK